jgi:hypothetical protein
MDKSACFRLTQQRQLTTMNVLPISYTDVSVASTAFFAVLYLLSAGNCRTGADG